MPIYSEEANDLVQEFLKASDEEALATKSLLDLMNSGCNDNEQITAANKRFTDAHSYKMVIHGKLQEYRLGN